jgi:hypothetical protein
MTGERTFSTIEQATRLLRKEGFKPLPTEPRTWKAVRDHKILTAVLQVAESGKTKLLVSNHLG